jgi:flagellar hook-length control protein FliK
MESALPRLREMMEQAGVQVASVDIREQKQTFSENESSHAQNGKNRTEHSLAEEAFVEESALATVGSTDNIVDYYA